jgi:hypothetical protein
MLTPRVIAQSDAPAAVLVVRYFRRGGGISMLRVMNEPMAGPSRGPDLVTARDD